MMGSKSQTHLDECAFFCKVDVVVYNMLKSLACIESVFVAVLLSHQLSTMTLDSFFPKHTQMLS